MLKKAKLVLLGCVASFSLSGSVRAEHFDFDPGMGPDPLNPNLAAGDGHPYDWYYQGINLDFVGGYVDGRENTNGKDDPNGNVPYIVFDGSDKSSAGHCLQIVFNGPNSDSVYSNPVQLLRFSFVDSKGNDVVIRDLNTGNGQYNVIRMWIKNTGNGLNWRTKIADFDGNLGAWNQSATMNVWRLDLGEADCTTNAYNAHPIIAIAKIVGVTGNYTVCDAQGACPQGG